MIDCQSMRSSSMFIHIYKVKQKETKPPSQPGFGGKRIGHLVEPCAGGESSYTNLGQQTQLTTGLFLDSSGSYTYVPKTQNNVY